MSNITRKELRTINSRASEIGAAVRYHFTKVPGKKRGMVLTRAVVMSQKDTSRLAREHKLFHKYGEQPS
jgi:uncharacterized FlgJ-related protein